MTELVADGERMRRIESLRRQVDLLTLVRDRMQDEPDDDYEAWAVALTPLTDRVLHDLAKLENPAEYVPYPHPIANRWWYVAVMEADD